jgi:hypothetical protein
MRSRLVIGCIVLGLVGVGAVGLRAGGDDEFDAWKDFDSRVLQGFKIAPVTLNLRGLNPALVGLGSYIVNAQGGCNDCHTVPSYAPGGDPFRGERERVNAEQYLAGGAAFGPFTSRNLTPRSNGLPANLTWNEFRKTMRKGTDFKERHPEISPLLQVMPWPVYGKMSTTELRAIYEYLKAIPSLPTNNPPPPTS